MCHLICPHVRHIAHNSQRLTSPPFASGLWTILIFSHWMMVGGGWIKTAPARASQNPPRKAAGEFGGWRPANIIFIFYDRVIEHATKPIMMGLRAGGLKIKDVTCGTYIYVYTCTGALTLFVSRCVSPESVWH